MFRRSVAVLAALLVAGVAIAAPSSAANAPQPPGPVPTKTVTQTQKVLVQRYTVPTLYGSHEACGRAWPGWKYQGAWTDYTCTQVGMWDWQLKLYEYRTEQVEVQVPMVWQVVQTSWVGSASSIPSCESRGRQALAAAGAPWNGYSCGSAAPSVWNIWLTRSDWV
ncbi:hypothetical protein [Cellulomonas palmilytica]|uniref:hypothetical protein n=1 Tax=Cellulomonas palmilytica TaxID=2608402 RepID=UPI001F24229D|nr:hypothetical protein [Cellulomonas palmilytica]UJP40201.1 hypothetical protein F1D97_01235 [Cellulomonas palmilytica]